MCTNLTEHQKYIKQILIELKNDKQICYKKDVNQKYVPSHRGYKSENPHPCFRSDLRKQAKINLKTF